MNNGKRVILVVLDGWGQSKEVIHNPIVEARTPVFDSLLMNNFHGLLKASGEAVGLPEGQMGNSEVGHTIIGAGKIIYTDFAKISKAAECDDFRTNPAFVALFEHVRRFDSVLHIKGLLSPGGVHSHTDHLYAFLKAAKAHGINKVVIHAFCDGRDTPPQSAHQYLKELEDVIEDLQIGFIATASGRFYAMDRDHNWDRLLRVEEAVFEGRGKVNKGETPSSVIANLHRKGRLDEQLEPIIFLDDKNEGYKVKKNDGIFIFNFRKDRSRMLTEKVLERKELLNLCIVTMTEYDKGFDCLVAFPPEEIKETLAKTISDNGLTQAHIAETEKFAHATYYLNGGQEKPFKGEEQILIESRKDVKTHDQAPEMKAREITKEACAQIDKKTDFIFINYANPDMIGHTGNKKALIKALEVVDSELEKLIGKAKESDYDVIITADHGNAELSFDQISGQNHTAHTTNPVPIIYLGQKKRLNNGALSDLAPTILALMNLPIPNEMTGTNLLN